MKNESNKPVEAKVMPYDAVLYAVLKLSQDITYTDPFTREERKEKILGIAGFIPYLDDNYLAFDNEPEADNIEQKNYLELDLPYFKGRCVIGNPPY